MKKTLYSKFDKKDITALPQVTFPGRIITIVSAGEADKAVEYLLQSDILGVDTETKPAFHRGEHHQVALLQVATRDTCFLFRLNRIGMTPAVKKLLEDKAVKKIGLSWHDDIHMLEAREAFTPGLFVDLQDMVSELGIKDLSLQKLYANIFRQKISKRQQLSNWEAPQLNDKQKQYASIDAWACILLYEEMQRLVATHDYDLVVVPEPENTMTAPQTQKQGEEQDTKHEAKKNESGTTADKSAHKKTVRRRKARARKRMAARRKSSQETRQTDGNQAKHLEADTHV